MADVRALLKAKRQEARISHPLASYSNGQLRCIACGPVKHASAWDGHLGSKVHRTTVARLKEEDRQREAERIRQEEEEQQARVSGKRKAEEQDSESDTEPKRRKVDDAPSASSSFPNDFFSDPSRAPLPPPSDDEDDDPAPAQPVTAPDPSLDAEWERFQRDVVNASDSRDARDTYENATVMAEPELASDTFEGFPPQQTDDAPAEPDKMDLEQARRQKEQDERELIMDRLLDEEQAQEEADMKVTMLKNRMEALMRKRNATKAAKLKAPT
ncbi:hypothetical protein C8F04DRAFT_958760 [Mycena alexandri]|uniref:Coiled-coil domain-containing protein 16 n=1 Tax=Mycena alexandri TaxID=1745969 RepID=A0AAD6X2I9_9AGAR|nr:hypothetical protein C8F04DRAFT_958760 [Mycena alexandri]